MKKQIISISLLLLTMHMYAMHTPKKRELPDICYKPLELDCGYPKKQPLWKEQLEQVRFLEKEAKKGLNNKQSSEQSHQTNKCLLSRAELTRALIIDKLTNSTKSGSSSH